jgi:lycopene beta-cyclase
VIGLAAISGLTYGQFLALFLLPPIAGLSVLILHDHRRRSPTGNPVVKRGRGAQGARSWLLLTGLVVVAIVYTIPWDNHLIAEGVWSYDPSRVSGITLGLIPLEEVLFFPLETLLVGLWVFWLTARVAPDSDDTKGVAPEKIREDVSAGTSRTAGTAMLTRPHTQAHAHVAPIAYWIVVVASALLWLVALGTLLRGWRPGTYLGWELVWALPPLALQLGLGADLLWRRRSLFLAALVPVVGYLAAADAVAIHTGIWTIARQQSLGMLLGGTLPLEELVFFVLTSALIVGGLILGAAPDTRRRLRLSP